MKAFVFIINFMKVFVLCFSIPWIFVSATASVYNIPYKEFFLQLSAEMIVGWVFLAIPVYLVLVLFQAIGTTTWENPQDYFNPTDWVSLG